jgi:hypothetical protein
MGDTWLVKRVDGRCERHLLMVAPAPPLATISRPVGKNAPNIPADVSIVQGLLNDVPPHEGGPDPKLVVDGLCWGKTIAAIHRFQRTFMKWPDERVDPGGRTLARLTAKRGSERGPLLSVTKTARAGEQLPPNPYLVPLIIALVPQIRGWVREALFELDRAAPYLHGSPGGIFADERTARLRRLQLHFRLEASPNRGRDFQFIREHFNRMENALRARAETELMAIFLPNANPAMERLNEAYTYEGGYREFLRPGAGPIDPGLGVSKDRIYLSSSLVRLADWQQIRDIIHELAHFVSNVGSDTIGDFGYGSSERQPIKSLGPYHRIRTAECYGNFALDCHYKLGDRAVPSSLAPRL